jgi:putative component of membrane protein insertase Oxa1/YidC/SpoIIIJ protein YidD
MKLCRYALRHLAKIISFILTGLRPLLGQAAECKFPVSCTSYATQVLKEHTLPKAIWLICKRIVRCNPFNRNTHD